MDTTQLQEMISKIISQNFPTDWGVVALVFVAALVGSYLGSYLKKKGENYATKEDFDALLKQLERTTVLTERIKNEFYLTKATYDKYIETVLSYYSNIYRYYRSCQNLARSTHVQYANGSLKPRREIWEKDLDEIVQEHRSYEGYIRLLLPSSVQDAASKMNDAFNDYRRIVKDEPDGYEKQQKLKDCFNNEVEPRKKELEAGLRRFLKVDTLTKEEL